jgi:hypothetical protein
MTYDKGIKDITNNLSATTPEWKSNTNDFHSKGSNIMNPGNNSTLNSELSKFGTRKGKKVTEKR